MTAWLAALAGVLLGAALAWALARGAPRREVEAATQAARAAAEVELARLGERLRAAEAQAAELRQRWQEAAAAAERHREALDRASDEGARLQERAARVPTLEQELARAQEELRRLQAQQAALQARLQEQSAAFEEQLKLLQDARAHLTEQFRNLAQDILDERARRFDEHSQTQLQTLLEPLRERLAQFEQQVRHAYQDENKERVALRAQVQQLMELNRRLSDEAHHLTQALRGSVKAQGHWGELILERVLEMSGLRRGAEYLTQDAQAHPEDGRRVVPDVVILLPQGRRLVVDAKVSLRAYERYTAADDEASRRQAMQAHLAALRAHLRTLADKRYQALHGAAGLDFVLAFVPIEPALTLALAHEPGLLQEAWERNVLLVGPSTLLFVLRTVAHLWRQEAQSRNAQEIARRGAEFYDKLSSFVEDFLKIGERLEQARSSFDAARGKLATGRGNLIRQAEQLRELGVQPSKALRPALLEEAEGESALPASLSSAGAGGAASLPATRPD
ncbi:DNA recombination protein RmuC [Tepidimonas alkaliphilus]|nr:DNA recombination protein RmuC [Tepidimonas alkaliphilus]